MDLLKRTRRVPKAPGEDNRLRILNLLHKSDMNVAELPEILGSAQSNGSKHLAGLRFTGIVADRRDGQFIYYPLRASRSESHTDPIDRVIRGL